jgi:hypothetical protein
MSFGSQQSADEKITSINLQSTSALRRNIAECEALKIRAKRRVDNRSRFSQASIFRSSERKLTGILLYPGTLPLPLPPIPAAGIHPPQNRSSCSAPLPLPPSPPPSLRSSGSWHFTTDLIFSEERQIFSEVFLSRHVYRDMSEKL